jgi:type II secretory pathway pseudopilin PulG
MRVGRKQNGPKGFSLLELLFALLLFQIGVLGVAGMVLTGQRTLNRAHLLLRGTMEARRIGDSLVAAGHAPGGGRSYPWGRLVWIPTGAGKLTIVATAQEEADTLALLRFWPDPGTDAAEADSSGTARGTVP